MDMSMELVRAVLNPDEADYVEASKLGKAAIPYLEKLAKARNEPLAPKAVYLAALIRDERSFQIVKDAAESDDPILRGAAALAIRFVPCKPISEVLSSLLNDKDASVRSSAIDSVGPNASNEVLESLETLVREERDYLAKERVLAALDRLSIAPNEGIRSKGNMRGEPQPRSIPLGMGRNDYVATAAGMGASPLQQPSLTTSEPIRQFEQTQKTAGMGRNASLPISGSVHGMGRQQDSVASGMGFSGQADQDRRISPWDDVALALKRAMDPKVRKGNCGCR